MGFSAKLENLCYKYSYKLKKKLQKESLFIIGACLVMIIEVCVFLYLILFSGKTVLPAFVLSCFFLTFFIFLVFRLYFLSMKSDFFETLSTEYLAEARQMYGSKRVVEDMAALATAATKLAMVIQHQEYDILIHLIRFHFCKEILKKISCFWFWKDYFTVREILLEKAVSAYLKIVQSLPTDLGAHVSLADAYVTLSSLYADPRKYPEFEAHYWVPPGRYGDEIQDKFFSTAKRAIEEFKILNEYAPGNSWVHAQLAYSYHDLQMPLEEIREYEIVLKIKPDDVDTMSKLGVLYFQQGMNAQGLKIYEELKKIDYKKSQKLIKFYGLQYNY